MKLSTAYILLLGILLGAIITHTDIERRCDTANKFTLHFGFGKTIICTFEPTRRELSNEAQELYENDQAQQKGMNGFDPFYKNNEPVEF